MYKNTCVRNSPTLLPPPLCAVRRAHICTVNIDLDKRKEKKRNSGEAAVCEIEIVCHFIVPGCFPTPHSPYALILANSSGNF